MLFRVIAMSRDLDAVILRRIKQFRGAWRRTEVFNIEARQRERVDGKRYDAALLYALCKLRDQPSEEEILKMSPLELKQTLAGPRCSPWACILALHELGAFDSSHARIQEGGEEEQLDEYYYDSD